MRKPVALLLTVLAFAPALRPADATDAAPQTPAALHLSLEQAVGIALVRNPEYRAAIAAVRVSADGVEAARGARAPTLTISDTYSSTDPVAQISTPFGPLPFGPNAVNVPVLTAQYTLFDDGAGAAVFGRAGAQYAATAAREREARGRLVATVTKTYVDDLAARGAASAADAALAAAHRSYADAKTRFDAGMAPRYDVLEAAAQVADFRVQAIDAHGAAAIAQERLAAELGVPGDTPIVTSDRLGAPQTFPAVDALVASAVERRGELQAAHAALDAAGAAIAQAKAQNAPSVGVLVSEGNVQPPTQPGFTAQFAVALEGVWRLFDGGATAARIAEAKDAYAQAQDDYDRLRAQAELDVREAYTTLDTARARAGAALEAVGAADEDARLAEIRYRGQVGTQLELRDALARDAAAREALIRAQADLRAGEAQLRFVAGIE